MRFSINREALLKPLQLVAGIIERRQTLPVLSNVLINVRDKTLSLTGTDLEVELLGEVQLSSVDEPGATTVPARKLMDICKSLPEDCEISIHQEGTKVILKSGRSRFTLSMLPAEDYPNIEEEEGSLFFTIEQPALRHLIERTGFAMAQQDVRYYLNGMLLEVCSKSLRAVATDGHRMAISTQKIEAPLDGSHHFIVPRKGIMGLARIILQGKDNINISLGNNHIRAKTEDFIFTSKLVDGKFPDYERVIPKGGDKVVLADRDILRQALNRASILSNEKYRGIRMLLSENTLKILANNPEQEEAEEEVTVEYQGEPIEIGFNVHYILNVLSAFIGDTVQMTLSNSNSGVLIEEPDNPSSLYIIMPMRL